MAHPATQKPRFWRYLGDRRVVPMAFLGVPYGMMFFLVLKSLQAWLKSEGVSNTDIGLMAMVGIPYTVKFMWAPVLDVMRIPGLSRLLGPRRAWLVTIHLCLIFGLVLMAFSDPGANLMYAKSLALALAAIAATQDILVDAYRLELLDREYAAPGVSMLVFGYRIGAITARAGPLYLAHHFSWPVAYLTMAALVFVGVVAAVMGPEPKNTHLKRRQKGGIAAPFKEFITRNPNWVWVFLFIVLYRFGDALINNMDYVFYVDIGFTDIQIANVTHVFGICSTIAGSFLGGLLLQHISTIRGLWITGFSHAMTNFMFVVLAVVGNNVGLLYFSVAIENVTSGMTTTAFLIYLSKLCRKKYAATQFALLTSLWSAATPLASVGGWLADRLDCHWPAYFNVCVLMSLPGLALIALAGRYPFGTTGDAQSA